MARQGSGKMATRFSRFAGRVKEGWARAHSVFDLWSERESPRLGAAVAFYAIFSLTPLVVTVVAVAGWFVGADFARSHFLDQLADLLGARAAGAVESLMNAAQQ